MADLIDREELIEEFKKLRFPCMLPSGIDYLEGIQTVVKRYSCVVNEAPAVNRWISCSERLPEQSGLYLAYFTFKDGTHATDITYIDTGCARGSITHWMPLPEPPEKE